MSTRRFLLTATLVLPIAAAAFVWASCGYRLPPVLRTDSVVVWAPHPDDETYGMGASIADLTSRGTSVTVVLLTDGEGSSYSSWWIEEHGSDLDNDGDIDKWDFALERRSEFKRATEALGVDHVIFLGGAGSQGATGLLEGSTRDQFAHAVQAAVAQDRLDPATHMTVADYIDGDSRASDEHAHPDHTWTHEAVEALAARQSSGFVAMKVYEYERPVLLRGGRRIVLYSSAQWSPKRQALAAYSLIGRKSTRRLWDSADSERREFIAEIR